MSLYLKMPIQPDNPIYSYEDFKKRYLELTGEYIQESPITNEQDTHYLIGSWQITQEISDQLVSEFPMVTITDIYPVGWVDKDPP